MAGESLAEAQERRTADPDRPGRIADDTPPAMPPRPYPGERPLGADEPSAPFEEPPGEAAPDALPRGPAGAGAVA